MAFVSLEDVSISFGEQLLLDHIHIQFERKQRICLLGRNGSGKSTLMKIIAGECVPDSGIVHNEQGVKIAYFAQKIPQDISGTVFSIIARGLGERGELMVRYHAEEKRLAETHDDESTLHSLHEELARLNAWSAVEEVAKITSRMSLDPDWEYAHLSGGQKRRVLLAAALVSEPDLLLLDEPTNHLDIASIQWMEEYLLREKCTILFVTHDRMLLRRLATRIVELDRGRLIDWSCTYDVFLERKQAFLDAEEKQWKEFDKKLAREEAWIRQGIKARRTRNEGRVRALIALRKERRERREREEMVSMQLTNAEKSGVLVMDVQSISYQYSEVPLFSDFTTRITRGDKIGIIGPNGCGKTTFIRVLLGEIPPLTGSVMQGTNLSITYFDQLRETLDEEKSVWENILPYGEYVEINGRQRHIVAYLEDFLFSSERAKTRVKYLSGGERNRLLLARLFMKPANVLVLDEPTNDLDAETLELLEALLVEFTGTVLLICHDRTFLNNVVTSTIVFDGKGGVKEYVGGYDDWQASLERMSASGAVSVEKKKEVPLKERKPGDVKKKLSYKETKELEALPLRIEQLEHEQKMFHASLNDPLVFSNPATLRTTTQRLQEIEMELSCAYNRWAELEA